MSNKQFSAGDHITSKCTKCKDTTNHTVVAMVGDKVARVECNTCGGIHNYRNVAEKKPISRSKASSPKPAKTTKIETEWENLLNDADPADATPYSMQMPIKPGALIQHPSFGLGRVIDTIQPNKMEVYFRSGVKLLRCSIA
ncbi:MAG: hypothetical protein PF441_04310 [Desulfuromusa sp.]|jgi:Zn ribbon nucleic-acid-binding protein|nr:hypothetical protein [Desulfuromusa sp.]